MMMSCLLSQGPKVGPKCGTNILVGGLTRERDPFLFSTEVKDGGLKKSPVQIDPSFCDA